MHTPTSLTLLVGTYTDTESRGIYSFKFNPITGESALMGVTNTPNPSFLAISPNNKMVFAVAEQQVDAAVSSFDFNAKEGTLIFKNKELTQGRGTCHVTWAGKAVVASNYSSGSLTVFPLDEAGYLKEGTLLEFFECGPKSSRQASSHIHSSQVSPDGKFLFAIDLGGDCIFRYPVIDGKVSSFEPTKIKVPAGQGPRHFEFSKDGRFMYLLTELEGFILAYDYNGGNLKQIQMIEANPHHIGGSADIHFSPDGRFLYASNRLKGDGLAIFSQDSKTGRLTYIGYQETAVHPRNFAISPDGKFILVACRDSNVIQVFCRNPKTGFLTDTKKDIKVPHPVCVILTPTY